MRESTEAPATPDIAAALDEALAQAAIDLNRLRMDPEARKGLHALAKWTADTFAYAGKILVCGNGGSAADAMHFCEEWTGRFRKDRPPYPAISLTDPGHITCVGNDYGFDQVFSRQILALGKPGDLLLILSTSGASPNLILAAQAGHDKGMRVAALLGRGGGPVRKLCDLAVVFPGETADRIQELHMLALHAVIQAAEIDLGHA